MLFNKILSTAKIPETWLNGIIVPIYKGKGSRTEADNYRGITLLSCLGKLFTSILNTRITFFVEDTNVLNEFQTGFRKNHSTMDNCFLLTSLIALYRQKRTKLYCAFIDYAKAFDTVWHGGLWYKSQK